MAICRIIETGAKPEQYEQVRAHLGLGDAAPPGSMVHIAAIGDDGLMRVIEVWESRDQAEAFAEKVIEEPVRGHSAVCVQQQHGQDGALLLAAELKRPVNPVNLKRPENSKIGHVPVVTLFLGDE